MRKKTILRFNSAEQIANPNLYDRGADLSTATLLALTDGLLARLEALARSAPVLGLSSEDRRRIGGVLLPGYDGEIVARVATALREEPRLFRDTAEDGDELRRRLQVAERLELVRGFLRVLLESCDDLYLVLQGDLVRRALAIMDRVRDGAALSTAADQRYHYDRLSALSPALSLLAQVRGAIQARRGTTEKPAKKDPRPSTRRAVTRRRLADLFYRAR